MTPAEIVGANIREARARAKMSQAALADEVGVRPTTVWRWETGVHAPEIGHLKQIAAVLKTTTDRLLARKPVRRSA